MVLAAMMEAGNKRLIKQKINKEEVTHFLNIASHFTRK